MMRLAVTKRFHVAARSMIVAVLLVAGSPKPAHAFGVSDLVDQGSKAAGDAVNGAIDKQLDNLDIGDLVKGGDFDVDPGSFIEDASDTYISNLFGMDVDVRCHMSDIGVPTVDMCGLLSDMSKGILSNVPDFLTLGPCQAQLDGEKRRLQRLLEDMCEEKVDDATKAVKAGDAGQVDFDGIGDSPESEGKTPPTYASGKDSKQTYDDDDAPLKTSNIMTSKKVSKEVKEAVATDNYDQFSLFELCAKTTSGTTEDVYEKCSKITEVSEMDPKDLTYKHYRDGVDAEYLSLKRTNIDYGQLEESLEQSIAAIYVSSKGTLGKIKNAGSATDMYSIIQADEATALKVAYGKLPSGKGDEVDEKSPYTQATRLIEQRYKRLAALTRAAGDNSDRLVLPSLSKMQALPVERQREYLVRYKKEQAKEAMERYYWRTKIEQERALLNITAKRAYIAAKQFYKPVVKQEIKEMLDNVNAIISE